MANNNGIFNAAIQGGTTVIASRWQYSTSSAFYATQAARIVAFATQIDADIPADPTLSQADFDLMEAICSSWWDNRSTKVASAAGYEPAASAIVAIWTQMRGNMLPPGAVPVPLDPGEVPKVLYDQAPGVIGYTEVSWNEAALQMEFPGAVGPGQVGAAFGNQPAETGGIRLSTGANGGVIRARKNDDSGDHDVMYASGIGDDIVIGQIDPLSSTNESVTLMGEFFDEGGQPFFLKVTSTDNAASIFPMPEDGTLLQSAEGFDNNLGGITIASASPATIHNGYGIALFANHTVIDSDGMIGGAITLTAGAVSCDHPLGEEDILSGGPIFISAGSVNGEGNSEGIALGGPVNISGGDVLQADDNSSSVVGGNVVIRGGTFTGASTSNLRQSGGDILIQGGECTTSGTGGGEGGNVSIIPGTGGSAKGTSSSGGSFVVLCGGASDVGGSIELTHGNAEPGGVDGAISLGGVSGSPVLRISTLTGGGAGLMGLWGHSPVLQPADLGAFVDSSTGTPSGTRTIVPDSGAASVNNNNATFVAWLNLLRTNIVRATGLSA